MNFHVLQSIGIILYLIADIELILCLKPGKHIVFCSDGTEPLLVPGNYIQGYKPFHSLLIAILKIDIPIPSQPFIVPVYLAFICVEVYLINAQIIHAEGVKDIKTPLLQFTDQIPPFQGGHNKICRSLKHIRRVLKRLYGRIIHAVKADNLFFVIKRNYHKGMNVLAFQSFILKRGLLADIFQISDDDMSSDAEIPVPGSAYLRRYVLKAFPFRRNSVCCPLIGIIVSAKAVPLKYVGTFPVKRFSQMLEQYLQRLVRSRLKQGDAESFIDDGLQILNVPDTALRFLFLNMRRTFTGPLKKLYGRTHKPALRIFCPGESQHPIRTDSAFRRKV